MRKSRHFYILNKKPIGQFIRRRGNRSMVCSYDHDGMPNMTADPMPPLLVSMPKGFAALAVGQTKGKRLLDVNGGPIKTVEIGRRRLIVYPSLVEYVEKLCAAPRQDARRNPKEL